MTELAQGTALDKTTFSFHRLRSPYATYGCAIVGTGLALSVRLALTPYIGTQFPYATVYFAVTIAAWYGGLRPALLATALGYLGVAYWVVPPYGPFAMHRTADYIGTAIYLFISLTSALFSEAQHRAQARAEQSALEARRSSEAVRESEARTRAILDTALDAIVSMDHNGRITEFNPAAERMFGIERKQALGQEMAALIIPPSLRESHHRGLANYLATGKASVLGKRIEVMALRSDGAEFPAELAITRVSADGSPTFSGHIHDISIRRKSETQQRFLAAASQMFASSLDYQTTLQSVAQLAVPRLADWCVVDAVGEAGAIQRVAVSHKDPEKIALAHELEERYPPDPNAERGTPQVIRTGRSEMLTDIPDELLRASVRDEEQYQIMKELGLKSYICVPLAARDRILGAITFIGAESGHRYGPDDLAVAEELARRAAVAIDNALLYQAERDRSQQLARAIQEIHHRVKNNLQAVSALLEMRVDPDSPVLGVEAVNNSLSQIKTIALVHDLLTHDQPIENVDATEVLKKLTAMLSDTMGTPENPCPINLRSIPIRMPVHAATALALVVNELINNAAKHTLSSSQKDSPRHDATIHVALEQKQEDVVVSVQDTGPGFPSDFDPALHSHIGLELVRTLVATDLKGSIAFRNGQASNGSENSRHERGAIVEITFSPARLTV